MQAIVGLRETAEAAGQSTASSIENVIAATRNSTARAEEAIQKTAQTDGTVKMLAQSIAALTTELAEVRKQLEESHITTPKNPGAAKASNTSAATTKASAPKPALAGKPAPKKATTAAKTGSVRRSRSTESVHGKAQPATTADGDLSPTHKKTTRVRPSFEAETAALPALQATIMHRLPTGEYAIKDVYNAPAAVEFSCNDITSSGLFYVLINPRIEHPESYNVVFRDTSGGLEAVLDSEHATACSLNTTSPDHICGAPIEMPRAGIAAANGLCWDIDTQGTITNTDAPMRIVVYPQANAIITVGWTDLLQACIAQRH